MDKDTKTKREQRRLTRELKKTSDGYFRLEAKRKGLDHALRRVEELGRVERVKRFKLYELLGKMKGEDCPARVKEGPCLLREETYSFSTTNLYAYYCRPCRMRHKENLEAKVLARRLEGKKD